MDTGGALQLLMDRVFASSIRKRLNRDVVRIWKSKPNGHSQTSVTTPRGRGFLHSAKSVRGSSSVRPSCLPRITALPRQPRLRAWSGFAARLAILEIAGVGVFSGTVLGDFQPNSPNKKRTMGQNYSIGAREGTFCLFRVAVSLVGSCLGSPNICKACLASDTSVSTKQSSSLLNYFDQSHLPCLSAVSCEHESAGKQRDRVIDLSVGEVANGSFPTRDEAQAAHRQ